MVGRALPAQPPTQVRSCQIPMKAEGREKKAALLAPKGPSLENTTCSGWKLRKKRTPRANNNATLIQSTPGCAHVATAGAGRLVFGADMMNETTLTDLH